MNYVFIFVATVLEVPFSVLKKGVSQYFCPYIVCTSHWCLVTSGNTLRREGLKSCSARKVPLLKKAHVQARLKFANDSEENWVKVLWSDETKIQLFGINSTRRVWRRRNAAYDPKNTIPTVKHGGGNIMLCRGGNLQALHDPIRFRFWESRSDSPINSSAVQIHLYNFTFNKNCHFYAFCL